jgi:hypothetical protein
MPVPYRPQTGIIGAQASAIGPAQDGLAAAIAEQFAGIADLKGVRVSVGEPPREPRKIEAWVDSAVRDWRQEYATTGTAGGAEVEESFMLGVFLLAVRSGEYARARETVTTMMQAVSVALRTDPTLGSDVFEAEMAGGSFGAGVLEQTRFVAAEVQVRVRAIL